jgi:hypothetical protein
MILTQRQFDIIGQMTNPTRYVQFVALCDIAGIPPMNPLRYAQTVGILLVARQQYPDIPGAMDAFNAFMNQNYMHMALFTPRPEDVAMPIPENSKPCCGGGKAK